MSKRDFPLSYHKGTKQWKRKVLGTVRYFGTDKQAALNKWIAEKDHWLAGRNPRKEAQAEQPIALTVEGLCDRFLYAKECLVESGELTRETWNDYKSVCALVIQAFGKSQNVANLGPDNFRALRTGFTKSSKFEGKNRGLVSVSNLVARTRVIFKFAADEFDVKVKYGQAFKKPSKDKLLAERQEHIEEHGDMFFSAEEVQAMLAGAEPAMRAMILLALNGGLGNTDLIRLRHVNIKGKWLMYPRQKNANPRRIPLWKETVAAIDALGANDWLFLRDGKPWRMDQISTAFGKLLDECGFKRFRCSFYSLRRTFRTVADNSRDQPACDALMGHNRNDTASIYRQTISDDRLVAVVECVRQALLVASVKIDAA